MKPQRKSLKRIFAGLCACALVLLLSELFYAQIAPPQIPITAAQIPEYLNYVVTTPAYYGELARLGLLPSVRASYGNPVKDYLYAAVNPLKGFLFSIFTTDWLQRVYASHGSTFTNRVNIDSPTDWLDVEPTFIALTVGTNDYSVAGWIKETSWNDKTDISEFQLYRAVHRTGGGDWNRDFMPLPSGYPQSADPMLAENPYSDGVWPKRMYYAGLFYQGNFTPPQRIGVYHADEPYQTWTGPVSVETNSDGDWFLDKPDVWVSDYFSTRGHVYVSYAKLYVNPNNPSPPPSEIRFSRSTDGGQTWSAPVTVTTGKKNASQVLVHPGTGRIYVIWVNFQNTEAKTIEMSQSDDFQGATWTAPEVAATGLLLGNEQINGGTKALSVIQARFNWIVPAIGIVFHEWEDSFKLKTDVYFVSKTVNGWQPKKRVNTTTTNDQWMPGLDFDPNGQWLVSFFDRSADPNNIKYEQAWARLQSDGTVIQTGKVIDVVATDPTNNHLFKFVGDYQDVWWWSYPNHPGIENEFILVYPQLDTQGEMHASGVH